MCLQYISPSLLSPAGLEVSDAPEVSNMRTFHAGLVFHAALQTDMESHGGMEIGHFQTGMRFFSMYLKLYLTIGPEMKLILA